MAYGYGSYGSRYSSPDMRGIPEDMHDRYKKNYNLHRQETSMRELMDGYSEWAPTYEEVCVTSQVTDDKTNPRHTNTAWILKWK